MPNLLVKMTFAPYYNTGMRNERRDVRAGSGREFVLTRYVMHVWYNDARKEEVA
jgi:hypothetical protein